jgi:hemoglobin
MPTPIDEPLSEEHIKNLVTIFYQNARADQHLGKLFNTVITDWDHHLTLVQDFWSKVLLGTHRYTRHPYSAHVGLPIKREHFPVWLALFHAAAKDTLPAPAALRAIDKAEHIADSFRRGFFPFDPL